MSKQDELKTQLEQAKKDLHISIAAGNKEIDRINKEIADTEVTYSIGDRFKRPCGTKYMMVLMSNDRKVSAVKLRNAGFGMLAGTECNSPLRVVNTKEISAGEMSQIIKGDYTRYWDNRKQEKC